MGGGPATADNLKRMQEAQQAAEVAKYALDQNARVGPGAPAIKQKSNEVDDLSMEAKTTFAMLKKKYGLDDEADVSRFLGGGSTAGPTGDGGYGGYGGAGGA